MKIGVVGCGALGSFYGAKLCALGLDVHFLLRSDYDAVRQNGVQVESPLGSFRTRPHCARDAAAIGPCDLVLIGLKTTANDQFPLLLPPLLGPETALLTLQNGLGNEERLAALFGANRVVGGLCFVCLNRIAPGVVLHTAHGHVNLGEFQRPAQARTRQYAALFCRSGIRCEITDDLDRAHWEKLVWNVPFNGLGVAGVAGYDAVVRGGLRPGQPLGSCLTTDLLLADTRWHALVRELMQEVIAAAAALGLAIPLSTIDDRIEQTQRMAAYKASTLLDFERRQPLELESLFLEPLRRARKVGAHLPRLTALAAVLQELDLLKRVAAE